MPSTYKGQNVSISYDENVCTHAGECVRGLPKVFNPERDPWVQPGDISDGAGRKARRRHIAGRGRRA